VTGVVLYVFLVTVDGRVRTVDTPFATAAAACQSAVALEVELRRAPRGDPNATVEASPRSGATPCPPRSRD
jgi:hypothetical protein